ncbi:MAG: recombinase RecT [Muribaculaceae bacterium]|nr:recombinase RecT [Muribaculaceae bacterium]
MSKLGLKLEEINALQPLEIATNESVREKFIQIYEAMWTRTTGLSGEAAFERESRNFNRLLSEKEDIRKQCTKFSIFTAFLDVAISGLTLEPGTKAQAYLMARNTPIDTYYDEKDQKKTKYETQCVLTVSGYGELVLRARCGQIQYADNPVIVYAEDEFEFGERNGQKYVNYGCRLPHTSGQITACFMKITRADGSIDYSVMLPEDWNRLAYYSAKQNRRWSEQEKKFVLGNPNALYGPQKDGSMNIDPGFLIAKCIKHAFKSYPKARVGRGTQLESQQVEEVVINDDLYGVDTETGEVQSRTQDTGFAPANDFSSGVTVNVEEQDDTF